MSWVQARPRQAVEREYHGPTDQDRSRWSVPVRWVLAWGHATRAEVARSVRGHGIAESGLNAPAFSVGRHQLLGGIRRGAGSQTPRLLDIFGEIGRAHV